MPRRRRGSRDCWIVSCFGGIGELVTTAARVPRRLNERSVWTWLTKPTPLMNFDWRKSVCCTWRVRCHTEPSDPKLGRPFFMLPHLTGQRHHFARHARHTFPWLDYFLTVRFHHTQRIQNGHSSVPSIQLSVLGGKSLYRPRNHRACPQKHRLRRQVSPPYSYGRGHDRYDSTIF